MHTQQSAVIATLSVVWIVARVSLVVSFAHLDATKLSAAHDGSHLFARLDIHIHPWVQSNCFN